MPSLADIANDVLARLDSIKLNTDVSNTRLAQLDTDIQNGFTNLAQGVQVLIAVGLQQNKLLSDNNKQNDTIICWLTNIANTLCDVKHNTDKEVKLQSALVETLHHIDDLESLVHAREAVETLNKNALKKQIEECCPPEEEPVLPCFEQCASPERQGDVPIKSDWQPVKYERHG